MCYVQSHNIHIEVRRQHVGVGSPLPLCMSRNHIQSFSLGNSYLYPVTSLDSLEVFILASSSVHHGKKGMTDAAQFPEMGLCRGSQLFTSRHT